MPKPSVAPTLKPYAKPALTFQKQLDQLMRRGMQVADPARALIALQRISYYRLSAYWHPFKYPNDVFAPDTTFERAVELYEFDRRLRLTVLDGIERLEVLVRTLLTYHFGHTYGAFGHTEATSFRPRFDHKTWLEDVTKEVKRSKERFLKHYQSTYEGFPRLPIWMASEVMSFGSLSQMFEWLHTHDQQELVKHWSIHQNVVVTWLHTLSYVRNVCAHHARLWNRELSIRPMLPNNLAEFNSLNPKRVYAVLCLMHHLLGDDPHRPGWSREIVKLLREMDAEPAFRGAMGIPADWASQSFWR